MFIYEQKKRAKERGQEESVLTALMYAKEMGEPLTRAYLAHHGGMTESQVKAAVKRLESKGAIITQTTMQKYGFIRHTYFTLEAPPQTESTHTEESKR